VRDTVALQLFIDYVATNDFTVGDIREYTLHARDSVRELRRNIEGLEGDVKVTQARIKKVLAERDEAIQRVGDLEEQVADNRFTIADLQQQLRKVREADFREEVRAMPELTVEMKDQIHAGLYIQAIKAYREITGCSLKHGKEKVDQYRIDHLGYVRPIF